MRYTYKEKGEEQIKLSNAGKGKWNATLLVEIVVSDIIICKNNGRGENGHGSTIYYKLCASDDAHHWQQQLNYHCLEAQKRFAGKKDEKTSMCITRIPSALRPLWVKKPSSA